jgi:hypothetical protein
MGRDPIPARFGSASTFVYPDGWIEERLIYVPCLPAAIVDSPD